ncbi:MAG: glycosyltransferase family 39 protein [Candidatus Aenigmatarchaeota archaeon]
MIRLDQNVYLLIAVFSVIQFFILARWPLVDWDESVYIGMGKWLYSGGQAGLWEPIRPLLIPVILGFFWFAGQDVILIGHIIALLFSIGCIFMVFLIGKEIFNKRVGLLAAVILSITPIFFSLSLSLLTDIPSTFFALVAIWFFIKKQPIFSGLAAGLAFLTRFPQGLVFLAIICLLFLDFLKRKKIKSIASFLIGFCIVIPYFVFNQITYGSALAPFPYAVEAVHGEYLWLYDLGVSFYFWVLPVQNLFFIFTIAGFYFYFKKKLWLKKDLNILVVCLLLFFSYFTLLVHKDVRFAIPFTPYLALLSSYGFAEKFSKMKSKNLLPLMIALSIASIGIIGYYLNTMQIEKPNILTECQLGPGHILSSTPLIAKYVDNRITGYYSLEGAFDAYRQFKNSSSYIIFTPDSFPCNTKECEQKRNNLFEIIKSENELICEGRGAYNQTTYIFKTGL